VRTIVLPAHQAAAAVGVGRALLDASRRDGFEQVFVESDDLRDVEEADVAPVVTL
jgi:hypothetical protein